MSYWISSDLDGTLFDHHDYSYDGANAGLARCLQRKTPIILNTSKTLRETLAAQQRLKLAGPIVVENGSALILPDFRGKLDTAIGGPQLVSSDGRTQLIFGAKRSALLTFIANIRNTHGWRFEGFNDWSVAQIAQNTGLSLEEAKDAADKHFSEPFVWQDSAENLRSLDKLANDTGYQLLKGGRFYHLQGECTKATPLKWLKQNFQLVPEFKKLDSRHAQLIALGDSNNDAAMLEAADIPVCIKTPDGRYPQINAQDRAYYTKHVGPLGWSEAILKFIR